MRLWKLGLLLLVACGAQAKQRVGQRLGIDPARLRDIGAVSAFQKTSDGVLLQCDGGSQVMISVLASDLIRVRASFQSVLPASRHSWAIEKTTWPPVAFKLEANSDNLALISDRLRVIVHKQPLLIDFLDAETGTTIQSDAYPMQRDSGSGKILARKRLGFDEHFYGLGEKAARLDKRRGFFTMWNSDTPGYQEGTDPLYQSIPFYLGWQRGRVYGLFFDNSYRSYFDLGQSSQEFASFGADGGDMDYYFFGGPTFRNVLSRYTELTGRMPLPPRWALGNQQSRWSYYPASVVEEVASAYRKSNLPLDVIHLDIHYMDDYRVFTWDRSRFPDPGALIGRLAAQGIKVVTIVDPGVKYQTSGYSVFDEGMRNNYFLHRTNGELFLSKVWPGDSAFTDFTLANARRWWGDLHDAYTRYGVAGIWNDMNEPSDFNDQTGANQWDVVSDDEAEHSLHAKNRNVFGMLMSRATYEGLERLRPGQRPYVISRSGFAGIQRYATMWTGDNTSSWEHLALTIPMFETLGLSGESFVGADIGGFSGRPDYELLTRWYQVAFLSPFCRNHKESDNYDQEPFRYPRFYREIVGKYLKLRYRLLPFLYSVLEEAHRTGMPLFRPLILNYPQDTDVVNLDDELMIGDALLAAPILRAGATRRLVYLPAGAWTNFWTGERLAGGQTIQAQAPLDTLPLYVKAGTLLTLGPEMQFVGEKPNDPLEVRVYLDGEGKASGTLYEDDGTSTRYLSGESRRTDFAISVSGRVGQAHIRSTGNYRVPPRAIEFNLVGDKVRGGSIHAVDNGTDQEIALELE